MCAICGILYNDPTCPLDHARCLAMRDSMIHRGPDDSGIYHGEGVVLGSRRLAILDLSEQGHMPMGTPDGRYWITYNGEAYNYRELRPALEAKGYRFRSTTDTEVLLYSYAEEGPAMLNRLNGMFAFAIWDAQERTLFLARDRMGIKPLYYAWQGGALYFASEQKALFAAGINPQFDHSTWEELLCFRYVAGERTPFAGVKRLLPGHYALWKDGKMQIRRWWNLSERAQALGADTSREPVAWFRDTFDASVALRMISDVPIGVLLSGGLDSSCVVASLGAKGAAGLASFTVRFKESGYDEGPLAKVVAHKYGLNFHELTVDQSELPKLLRGCSWFNDEPLAQANDLHLYAIAKYAKPLVTVLLSGEGADEMLGGYVRYRPLRHLRLLDRMRPWMAMAIKCLPTGVAGSFGSRMQKLNRFLEMSGTDSFVLFDSCDVLPTMLSDLGMKPDDDFLFRRKVLTEAKMLYPGVPLRQAMYLDQHTFLCSILDRNDRTTMGASIECRVPFLDYRLVEGLAALPSSVLVNGIHSKILLRKAFSTRLPEAIQRHRKWGFGVPWSNYFQTMSEFRELIATLPSRAPVCDGPFDRSKVKQVVDAYLRGDLSYHAIIRQLVFIAVWHKTCVADVGPGIPDTTFR
jgi:asparagine synthase (glutamine-hydrolysing)